MKPWDIIEGDCLTRLRAMPDSTFHCVVTSPPYWGLRDYGVDGQHGLERTPQEYVARQVEVFREVRRVMRDDGTLWLNIGDSYAGSGRGGYVGGKTGLEGSIVGQDQSRIARGSQLKAGLHETARQAGAVGRAWVPPPNGTKNKDLVGIPWMLAFALRDDGWYLRSEIIWAKRSAMPESVRDRPSKAHEQVFLLTKRPRYFFDSVAAAEPAGMRAGTHKARKGVDGNGGNQASGAAFGGSTTRNMRSVWFLSNEPFKGAHFAVMPTELVRRCLKAGTSEMGCCPTCGAPWVRIIKKERVATRPAKDSKVIVEREQRLLTAGYRASDKADSPYHTHNGAAVGNRDPYRHCTNTVTVGWKPKCACDAGEPVPCLVLDPYAGAGTVLMVARRLGCRAVGIELNPKYAAMARKRIVDDAPLLNR